MHSIANHLWAVVPAAGIGLRMGTELPKQYLELAGKSVIDHTISMLLAESRIDHVLVGIKSNDADWLQTEAHHHPRVAHFVGGQERAETVLNGIEAILCDHNGSQDDWVLVHDAVRPCLSLFDLSKLIDFCMTSHRGAILGCPVVDTIKRVDAQTEVASTEDRSVLWRALTPQLFNLGALKEALEAGAARGIHCTDESQAMERLGHSVPMIAANPSNMKITEPADLRLAEFYLRS
ncbi:MAG: 2-C-methyl-D-erythritol 4-phosphate cytidylyltransferase [Acidiferrobacterales bacterium]|nr:2-C-methyl-D-erythritol 4-phosphate cytidylyltransferase [Acidiferrobacterales bacterium]